MNPILAQLAHEAGITINAESEKFAELIVGECASVCENSNYEFGTIFTKMIKEHFGVE